MDAYDLRGLFAHRDLLDGLDPAGPASLAAVEPHSACRSVALLAGSFNPPTSAHVLLAERALREGFDHVAFVLARRPAGKDPSGLIQEDRLLALRLVAGARGIGILVSSCALYADQAAAAAEWFPGAEITFLVGSDKVEQIFDSRWYADREAALEGLFGRARLLVSPRADDGERVRAILGAPENRRFSDRVSVMQLHPAVSDLSSTRVRGLLQAGADPSGLVPGPVARFLGQVRAFAPSVMVGGVQVDAYLMRARLLDALWAVRDWAESSADLRALVEMAMRSDAGGAHFRDLLLHGLPGPEDLRSAQASS
ncbi:MAG: hypothetical protein HY775_03585 [Acidobacteria bacterium]|nr:hypothetical protein [Acidobacteriota bacterium]